MLKIYAGKAPMPEIRGLIRDIRPVWLLEEIGAPYELEYIDAREDVLKPEYLEMNPFGKIPVLHDGELAIFESGAICQYIADKFGMLIPRHGTPERAKHDQWVFAAIANFEFNASRVAVCDIFLEKNAETDAKRANALENLDGWLPQLNKHLEKNAYVTGNEFQLADLLFASILRYVTEKNYLEKYPAVAAWVRGNLARPAFLIADSKNGG